MQMTSTPVIEANYKQSIQVWVFSAILLQNDLYEPPSNTVPTASSCIYMIIHFASVTFFTVCSHYQ
jgi:hypothetical protein